MNAVQKDEFVALRYTGKANGVLFDSNEEDQVKKLHPDAEARESIVVVGRGMIVPGLDKALEGKEIGTRYEVSFDAKEGFGERRREMVKTIPLKVFTEKQVHPYPGMTLVMDNMTARVITVSGARVITDFNSPLAGKTLAYSFTIARRVTDEDEKVRALFELSFKAIPTYEIKEQVIVKGPKILEAYTKAFSPLFKELVGKELSFEVATPAPEKADGEKKGERTGHYHSDGTYHEGPHEGHAHPPDEEHAH